MSSSSSGNGAPSNPSGPLPSVQPVAKLSKAARMRTAQLFKERRNLPIGIGAVPLAWPGKQSGTDVPELIAMMKGGASSVPTVPQTLANRAVGIESVRTHTPLSSAAAARVPASMAARQPSRPVLGVSASGLPTAPGVSTKTSDNKALSADPADDAAGRPVELANPDTTVTGKAGDTDGLMLSPPAAVPPRPATTTPTPAAGRRRKPNMTLSALKSSPAVVGSPRPQLNGLGSAAGMVESAMNARSAENTEEMMVLPQSARSAPATTSAISSESDGQVSAGLSSSSLDEYSNIVDPHKGTLRFGDKAILDDKGVRFAGGITFRIGLDDVELLQEQGRGNYGTVFKVLRGRRRTARRINTGLAGTRQRPLIRNASDLDMIGGKKGYFEWLEEVTDRSRLMAMKEIRFELDSSRLAAIVTELEILNDAMSPQIVDFFGAFFQESGIYICMEYMDGGSLEKLYDPAGIPEPVLSKIALNTVLGLKYLKDEHSIIHRDIKPTNILTNSRGQVKICDFGVSGNLVGSLASTNIGCQSYMAPERIAGPRMAAETGMKASYSARSDVWSVGLTIVECAIGRYPYPTDVYGQLEAIVSDAAPDLPEGFSDAARDFIASCLQKQPLDRPTYDALLDHEWLQNATELVGPEATYDYENHPLNLADPVPVAGLAGMSLGSKGLSDNGGAGAMLTPEENAKADEILDREDPLRYPIVDRDIANWVRRGIQRRRAKLRANGIVPEE